MLDTLNDSQGRPQSLALDAQSKHVQRLDFYFVNILMNVSLFISMLPNFFIFFFPSA